MKGERRGRCRPKGDRRGEWRNKGEEERMVESMVKGERRGR